MSQLTYSPEAIFDVDTSDVVYLAHDGGDLLATVYRPRGDGPFPGLLDVHGGRWFLNDRSDDQPMNNALAASGIVVFAVDFRLAPQHPYPAQVQDANYAIRWMKANADWLNIDPAAIGAMGCSSGGHTVALNGMRPTDPQFASIRLPHGNDVDSSLRYMICCWPVLDPHARYTWAKEIGDERFIGPTEDYFTEHASLHEGNPQEILDRGEGVELPPAIIIQGENDSNIPLFIPHKFEAAYRKAGGDIQLELFPGMPHRFGNMQEPEADRAIALMKAFIARQLSRPAVAPA